MVLAAFYGFGDRVYLTNRISMVTYSTSHSQLVSKLA